MDKKLTQDLSLAINQRIHTESVARDAHNQFRLLSARWNAELVVGDVVGYDGNKCIVDVVAEHRIEVVGAPPHLEAPDRFKFSPIRDAPLVPWTDAGEQAFRLRLRKRALWDALKEASFEDVAAIEAVLKARR